MKTSRSRLAALFAAALSVGFVGDVLAVDATTTAVLDPNVLTPKPTTPPTKTEKDAQGYLKLGFDHLAYYNFTPPAFDPAAHPPGTPPPTGEEQIPELVKSWNGKKAMITGYMIPVKMDKGLVTEFLLMRNTLACCYGTTPSMNEWVVVKMRKGVEALMDVPVNFYGNLKVGATFDGGYMTALYEFDGERMESTSGK